MDWTIPNQTCGLRESGEYGHYLVYKTGKAFIPLASIPRLLFPLACARFTSESRPGPGAFRPCSGLNIDRSWKSKNFSTRRVARVTPDRLLQEGNPRLQDTVIRDQILTYTPMISVRRLLSTMASS